MLVNPGWTSDGPRAVERGAKLGAILDRRAATLSFRERLVYQPDLVLSTFKPHCATVELSFASRGSGVQIPSAPLGIAGYGPASMAW